MAKEVWVRGERKKYYTVEPDFWQVIRNVLSSREQREVQVALNVLRDSIDKLRAADDTLSEEEKAVAAFYLQRIGDLQGFFQFAQLALGTILGSEEAINFDTITKIEIG